MLVLGASLYVYLDLASILLEATPGDIGISLCPSLHCQLKSYSIHILFAIPPFFSDTGAITYNLLFKNQIRCWLDDRCSINPLNSGKLVKNSS